MPTGVLKARAVAEHRGRLAAAAALDAAGLNAAGLNAAAATAAGRGKPTSPSTLRREVARAGAGIRMMRAGRLPASFGVPVRVAPRSALPRKALRPRNLIAGRDEGDAVLRPRLSRKVETRSAFGIFGSAAART
jgi:hypothetical protein